MPKILKIKSLEKGFTLIELLVVIAIISLLSSIVLAALNSARLKGQDSAIISEVLQMRTLLEENYNDYGSYINLSNGAAGGQGTDVRYLHTLGGCLNTTTENNNDYWPVAGTYAQQAQAICQKIVAASGAFFIGPAQDGFWLAPFPAYNQRWVMEAWLPYAGVFYCLDGSGKTSMKQPQYKLYGTNYPGCVPYVAGYSQPYY